jgi:hypothetical protein
MTDDEREAEAREERAYTRGSDSAWISMLALALRHSDAVKSDNWSVERGLAIAMLRQVCDAYGDNDWTDSLNLSDIIEKHLWRNLESATQERS